MESFISTFGNQVQVYKKCPYRRGWIICLQVNKSSWGNKEYDKFR
jgi:hypothetical protein